MAAGPLVAVGYQADEELASVNSEVLADAAEIIYTYDLDEAGRAEAIRSADVLLAYELPKEVPAGALGDPVGRADSRGPGRLGFIQFLSTGVDAVDFSQVPDGLTVACNAGAYAGAVSEHALAMTLSLAKRLPQRHAALAAGRFDKWSPALTLSGATCVILGYGGIGTTTARFMRAFGARICAVTRTGTTTEPADLTASISDLDQVLPAADVLVIALPLTLATRGLIGARELALMKQNAILVNVARGPIIDQAALYEHLRTHRGLHRGNRHVVGRTNGRRAIPQRLPISRAAECARLAAQLQHRGGHDDLGRPAGRHQCAAVPARRTGDRHHPPR